MVTVSVIVPFRNAEAYLGEAIASVEGQTFADWELLLIDDGSTDNSRRIAEEAAALDSRLRLLDRPSGVPGNAAAARNLGIERARGEFVAFLDADDVYERSSLQSRLQGFEGRPDVAVVYGPTRWWHPGAEERDWTESVRREAGRVHQPPELLNRVLLLRRGRVPCTCGMLIRRRALEVTGGFEESFHLYEDQTLWAKLLLRFPVYVTDVVGARYRQHEESTSAHAERSGVYHYRRPHESRADFLTWVDRHARSSGLADPSVQRALRLASARYGDGRAGLTPADWLTIAGHAVYGALVSVLRRRLGRRAFGARRRGRVGLVLTPRQWGLVRRATRALGVHRLENLLTFLRWPLQQVADALLRRVDRDPRLVAMGSPAGRFADNAALVFLYLSEGAPELSPVWISGSAAVVRRLRARGYAAELRWSWSGVRTCIRAGTYVYSAYRSDISRWFSSSATTVCLWHGIPIKRIMLDLPVAQTAWTRILPLRHLVREPAPDLLLSSTRHVTQESLAHAFGIPEERCLELGYPRNDHLVHAPRNPHSALVARTDELDRIKAAPFVVGMFLTWRDDRAVDIVDAQLVNQLAVLCADHGALLVYKAHYNVAPVHVDPALCVHLAPDVDLNTYLGFCNILITDYSSVALDFLLLARPILYFMPDLERYVSKRGVYIDPLGLPGTVTRDQASLIDGLRRLLTAPRPLPADEGAHALRRRVWGDYDGHATAAVAEVLRRHIDRRRAEQQRGTGGSPVGHAQKQDGVISGTTSDHETGTGPRRASSSRSRR